MRGVLARVWESRWWGVLLSAILTVASAFLIYFIAPPGISVAILGLVAAVMSLRSRATATEKATWMLIISALLIGEVLAVRQDRALAQAAEHSRVAEERRHFDDIGEGIKIAVRQGQTQFDATVKQQTDQFNATMGKAEQNLNQMTGGHAYPLVTVLPIPMKGTANKLRLALSVVGETPLFDVSVELRPLPLPKKLSATDFVTSGGETPIYSSPSISSNRVLLLPAIEPSMTQQSDYLISTIARNGSFTERLHLRNLGVIAKTKDGVYLPWEQSWEITRRLPSNKEMVIATQPWQKMEFVHGEVAAE